MRNSCPLTSLLTLTPSRLFPILLDPKSFQTILASVTWLPGHVLSIHCRLIITIYLCLANPNPSQSLSTHSSYNIEDFNSIGEAIWNFISLVYSANWDSLHADKQSNSLRRKIVAKFTPKIYLASSKNSKEVNRPNPANIERIPLPIPAKSQKGVNIILKYFKNIKLATNFKQPLKLYAQASKQNISMSEVIKIKEAFSSIGTKKIDQISQIRYSLVVILVLNGVSEIQYKGVMMIDDGKYQ